MSFNCSMCFSSYLKLCTSTYHASLGLITSRVDSAGTVAVRQVSCAGAFEAPASKLKSQFIVSSATISLMARDE